MHCAAGVPMAWAAVALALAGCGAISTTTKAAAAVCSVLEPPESAAFRTGDLVFVRPQLDPSQPFDNAIMATGAATIDWLREQGIDVPSNETADHVALAYRNSTTGCLAFLEAVPPAVIFTPVVDFWRREVGTEAVPTTVLYRGWFQDAALQQQLAGAAVTKAMGELGKPYADDFEAPPAEFYCSSLVTWSYGADLSGRPVFFPPTLPVFTLLFEPLPFWQKYYEDMGVALPVDVTGNNPTLLLHSPALHFETVGSKIV